MIEIHIKFSFMVYIFYPLANFAEEFLVTKFDYFLAIYFIQIVVMKTCWDERYQPYLSRKPNLVLII